MIRQNRFLRYAAKYPSSATKKSTTPTTHMTTDEVRNSDVISAALPAALNLKTLESTRYAQASAINVIAIAYKRTNTQQQTQT